MIEIDGRTFSSTTEVREHVFNILNNAPFDEPLSGTDAKLVHEIFLHHPEAEEKTGGKPIQYFMIGKHPQAGARAFCVVLPDGSAETFSIKKCFSVWARKVGGNVNTAKPSGHKKTETQPKNADPSVIIEIPQSQTQISVSNTLREQILRALASGEKKRSEIIDEIHGETVTQSQKQGVQDELRKLLEDEMIIKVKHGFYAVRVSGIQERLQRVMTLYIELGKEIDQIQKLLAEESK